MMYVKINHSRYYKIRNGYHDRIDKGEILPPFYTWMRQHGIQVCYTSAIDQWDFLVKDETLITAFFLKYE